jgi:hypothetical protein
VLTARAIGLGRASIVRPRGADVLWLLGAIAFGGAIGPYLLMYGLHEPTEHVHPHYPDVHHRHDH